MTVEEKQDWNEVYGAAFTREFITTWEVLRSVPPKETAWERACEQVTAERSIAIADLAVKKLREHRAAFGEADVTST